MAMDTIGEVSRDLSSRHDGVSHKWLDLDGLEVFHREADTPGAPVLLLLHGHWLLETNLAGVASRVRGFFGRVHSS